ncbi:MAG: DUF2284 domain-containing protein [Thermoplasmata archaeon]|nr:DUF2284 domain-containing protein [Thermoplasmata archaeon]
MRKARDGKRPNKTSKSYAGLAKDAYRLGATEAKIIDADKIVIDERVRMKCEIPRCSNYDAHLMCPPNLMPVREFRKMVRKYRKALIVQIEADYDSNDKSDSYLTGTLCEELESRLDANESEKALHRLVNKLEAIAFKKGFYLSIGLIGGECLLCPECVGPSGGEECRHPFEARPSMEAMGIDVIKTCEHAAMPIRLSSSHKVRWTGLILLG